MSWDIEYRLCLNLVFFQPEWMAQVSFFCRFNVINDHNATDPGARGAASRAVTGLCAENHASDREKL